MEYYITDNYGVCVSFLRRIETQVLSRLYQLFKPKITNKYAEIIEHKNGGLYAIPIMDLNWFGDIKALIKADGMGDFKDELTPDWDPDLEDI